LVFFFIGIAIYSYLVNDGYWGLFAFLGVMGVVSGICELYAARHHKARMLGSKFFL